MTAVELDESLEELMADRRLVELCALQRTGDEVLDVISLSENQHSDILAWMLDAREGHGQGDEILRDLLISASTIAAKGTSGMDGRGVTAKFFAEWPPSRIRTTSFGSAFTARELGMTSSDRVDIFVVDSQNGFILLIENKAGAKQNEEQLDRYRKSFMEAVASNSKLNQYSPVYVALDRQFDGEDPARRPSSSSWLHMNYSWLETSAVRALEQVKRGNNSARLVVSYCNRQTDWENPANKRALALAAELHQRFPEAVKHLISFSQGRAESEWLKHRGRSSSAHWLFVLQNKSAVALLKETQGMAMVKAAILAKLPLIPPENIQHRRAWLDMCPTGWHEFEGENWWPVFLSVRYADAAKSKYAMALCWNADYARTRPEAEELRHRLESIEPKFEKHSGSSRRRVVIEPSLTLPELIKSVAELDGKLFAVLSQEASAMAQNVAS
jgi:hypothetical protein